ncbi:conserved Plasmodium protein, unknown function [Plasmodium knowlesi strain H]|uniref:Dual specificity protein phosphatase n=3 Tax=Plasmodium knowlesi TaxID=5850 RepID=A0A5K1UML3_PLAKH|nr:conserved Plasmodium protein, unknown function [Plasmodium knowlesi strain H]OTN68113.1 Uncharacterized protein PKNOH_S04365900 [Plasmodium knowlesi]CAA9987019.1 conserved Plasmodium protein, unknown function [Plasmodium knowlesi strain H]SBO26687.1 conserved Plasmodium protein, unknown function [Plasmodium knowlesi strain H]SBO28224.1 conserved Plasmodium protein, unknown function [Plasmodium knowlesi strain H]VVS76493.1 conserved Plasmodium protein, unknown function [Plasmodium knowlesi s|eukprot:XP_002258264.1 hypothetical protein, conserved in Plasmodium species [Plasmodium knowlesi strain H]
MTMATIEGTRMRQLSVGLTEMKSEQGNDGEGRESGAAYKRGLREIITRVYVGDYEDSKNILLLGSIGITHIIVIRCNEEYQMARIIHPHKFEYYIIDLESNYNFNHCTHLKFLLDDILFENNENRIFIHSYISLQKILSLLVFYIATTMNLDVEEVLAYVKKIVPNFSMDTEESDNMYYFTKRHMLTYYPGECTSYLDVQDKKGSLHVAPKE